MVGSMLVPCLCLRVLAMRELQVKSTSALLLVQLPDRPWSTVTLTSMDHTSITTLINGGTSASL
ncbi:hypothetical protein I315_03117 [Cryptococcus gattii Ru294]|nr:hypothetical protein I315_03117 [Cryptococcus gattii Ru294]